MTGHDGRCGRWRRALRRHPVIISGGDDTIRMWRLLTAAGRRSDDRPRRPGVGGGGRALPTAPVIISLSGGDDTIRVWRPPTAPQSGAAGGHGGVDAVAAGALPDGTRLISRGGDGRIRVCGPPTHPGRRAAEQRPPGGVGVVAAGALPDGTPVIISGSYDGTVRVWRLADGTPSASR